MKKTHLTPVAAALGTALVLGVAAGAAQAANPFGMQDLSSGYQLAMGDKPADSKPAEGKCGEAKCGADKKASEAKCGGDKKAAEAKCGGEKKMEEGKCGAK